METTKKISEEEKEVYLGNLTKGFAKLSTVIGASGIDASLATYAQTIATLTDLLRYKEGNEDPRENLGVYEEVKVDLRSGLPDSEDLILFSSMARSAATDLERLGSTHDAARQTIDVLLNGPNNAESGRMISDANDKIRKINFTRRLLDQDYAFLPEGLSTKLLNIDLVDEDKEAEHFSMSYFGWDMGKKFFAGYSLHVDDDKGSKFLGMGEIKGQIYRANAQLPWEASLDFQKALKSSFGLHPRHMGDAISMLEGTIPQKITYLGIDSFESAHSATNFGDLLQRYPDAGILVANTITITPSSIEGEGKEKRAKYDPKQDKAQLYILCSDHIKAEVNEWYKHNKHVEFKVIPW